MFLYAFTRIRIISYFSQDDLITATPKPSSMRRMGRPLTVLQFRTPQETSVRENFD